jgi:MMPL family
VAVTGDHTVGNDFTTLSASDLQHGELDFGLPIATVILLLVFGAVVAGLMPGAHGFAFHHRGPGHRCAARPGAQPLGLHRQHDDQDGPGLGIDYSLFMISRFREERGHGRGKEAPRDQHSRESPPAKKAGEGTTTPPRSPRTDLADRRVRSGQE